MQNIVFVGASIAGLSGAIELKKRGLNPTVIDPRAGNYTRPGTIDLPIFDKLQEDVAPDGKTITASSSRHIKDAERELFRISQEMGINVQRKKFDYFNRDGSLQVTDSETQKKETIPCDLVFDATGSRRSVIAEVNGQTGGFFRIESLDENPMKNHFIAYVEMTKEDIFSFYKPLPRKNDPVFHVFMLEKLRSDFGWTELRAPYFKVKPLNKNKVCIYTEHPPELTPGKYEQWIKAVLVLTTGKEDIDFRQVKESKKYTQKPRFNPFLVSPHKVEQVYPGSTEQGSLLPMVVPIGDAQIEPDYRMGHGIVSAVNRFKAFSTSLEIHGDTVSVDLAQYQEKVSEPMSSHEKVIQKFYQKLVQKNHDHLVREKKLYSYVLEHIKDHPDVSDGTRMELQQRNHEINSRIHRA